MATFSLVERKIGRKLHECIDVKAAPDTVRGRIETLGRDAEIWVPPFETLCEIALDVANYYRKPQSFEIATHHLWPYVDGYQSLYLDKLFLDPQRSAAVASYDRTFLNALVNSETETIYARAREVLVFSDGVQVMDPFMTLSAAAIDQSWENLSEPGFGRMTLPPGTLIRQNLLEIQGSRRENYAMIWAACLQEAYELAPLVRAGYVRLTPGRHFGPWNARRVLGDPKGGDAVMQSTRDELATLAAEAEPEADHAVLRAAQTMIDSVAYDHSAPFFFASNQLDHAQSMLTRGFGAIGVNGLQTRRASLSTINGVSAAGLSDDDLLALRRDEDSFNQWREFRRELSGLCISGQSESEIQEVRADLTSRWRETLGKEQKRDSFVFRNMRREGFVYGAVGAVVAGGGAALTSPISLPAALILAAGGALTGGGLQAVRQWHLSRDQTKIKAAANLAFERHLLAVDRKPPAE